jgi:hypothetical protein
MKGLIEWAIAGFIVSITFFVVIIIPFMFTRIQNVETIDTEITQDNAQLTLLALLSSTYEKKQISQIIVEHIMFDQYPNINEIISPRLEKFTNCYKLTIEDKILAQKEGCEATKYTAEAKIALPYQPEKKIQILQLTVN